MTSNFWSGLLIRVSLEHCLNFQSSKHLPWHTATSLEMRQKLTDVNKHKHLASLHSLIYIYIYIYIIYNIPCITHDTLIYLFFRKKGLPSLPWIRNFLTFKILLKMVVDDAKAICSWFFVHSNPCTSKNKSLILPHLFWLNNNFCKKMFCFSYYFFEFKKRKKYTLNSIILENLLYHLFNFDQFYEPCELWFYF